jgi:hypothetical protein
MTRLPDQQPTPGERGASLADLDWLLASAEPWTQYRTRLDLLGQHEHHPQVCRARAALLAHRQVLDLLDQAATWPGYAL